MNLPQQFCSVSRVACLRAGPAQIAAPKTGERPRRKSVLEESSRLRGSRGREDHISRFSRATRSRRHSRLMLAVTLILSLLLSDSAHTQVLPKDAIVVGKTIPEWSVEW